MCECTGIAMKTKVKQIFLKFVLFSAQINLKRESPRKTKAARDMVATLVYDVIT